MKLILIEMTETGFNETSRVDPFSNLKISNNDILNEIDERSPCSKCRKSRKFFCYSCYVPVEKLADILPYVEVRLWKPLPKQ